MLNQLLALNVQIMMPSGGNLLSFPYLEAQKCLECSTFCVHLPWINEILVQNRLLGPHRFKYWFLRSTAWWYSTVGQVPGGPKHDKLKHFCSFFNFVRRCCVYFNFTYFFLFHLLTLLLQAETEICRLKDHSWLQKKKNAQRRSPRSLAIDWYHSPPPILLIRHYL